jgi:hypothetical protein
MESSFGNPRKFWRKLDNETRRAASTGFSLFMILSCHDVMILFLELFEKLHFAF